MTAVRPISAGVPKKFKKLAPNTPKAAKNPRQTHEKDDYDDDTTKSLGSDKSERKRAKKTTNANEAKKVKRSWADLIGDFFGGGNGTPKTKVSPTKKIGADGKPTPAENAQTTIIREKEEKIVVKSSSTTEEKEKIVITKSEEKERSDEKEEVPAHPGKKLAEDEEDEEPPIKVNDIVDDQFKVLKILGQGGFGAVFEVIDQRTRKNAALKIELQEPENDEPGLQLETGVIKRMRHSPHFPKYIHHGKYKGLVYVVMQLLGDNLLFLRRKCPERKFTLRCSVQLAVQCLDCVEAFHGADLLHRDIKPENYVIGRNGAEKRIIYLLDFGMVRRYRAKGVHRKPRPQAAFRGTIGYASPRVLSNMDASRCDDLCSWFYIVTEFMCGDLPWHAKDISRKQMALFKKTMIRKLLATIPDQMRTIYDKVMALDYYDVPPYDAIKALLNEIMKTKRYKMTDPFDWETGGEHHAIFLKLEEKRQQIKLKKAAKISQSQRDEMTMRNLDYDDEN